MHRTATLIAAALLSISCATLAQEVVEVPVTPPADGARDANGNCLGQLQIFRGQALRCRSAGTQTVGQDCCRNRNGTNPDSLGSESDNPPVTSLIIDPLQNQCDERDLHAAFYADNGECVSLGEYCAERWPLIGCVQQATAYCCFNSKLARIIQEQGRAQLPGMGGFGTPEEPNCRGFQVDEFQSLDFSKIDLSEYYAEIRTQSQAIIEETTRANAQSTINP